MTESKLITFEFDGIRYEEDTEHNRYYKVVDSKRTRISKNEHREMFDQYIEEVESNASDDECELTEEPTSTVKKSKKKKSKGDAFDGIEITKLQQEFIKHLPDTCFWEDGLDSSVWIDVLCDEIGGEFAGKPMRVGAMVSTLREKGVLYTGISRVNGKNGKWLTLTDVGKKIAKQLGLED